MPLNTPRTWVTGELLTATLLNVELRDALTNLQAALGEALLGSVVVGGTALVGTYDSSKPIKVWAINGAYSTDASGDATILDSAAIGSGCVLGGSVSGADVYAVNGPLRAVSGALKMRVFNDGSTALVSSTAALQGIVIGQ